MEPAVDTLIAAELQVKCRKLVPKPPAQCFGVFSYRFTVDIDATATIHKELPEKEQVNIFESQKERIVSFKKDAQIKAKKMSGFSGNSPFGGHTKKGEPNSARHSGQTWQIDGGRCVVYTLVPWPPNKPLSPPMIAQDFIKPELLDSAT